MIAEVDPGDIVTAESVDARVQTYRDAVARITEAMLEIARQERRIDEAMGPDSKIRVQDHRDYMDWGTPSKHVEYMDRQAWHRIVNLSGIRRVLSVDAARKLDHQLANEKLPEVTPESVKAMLSGLRAQAPDFLADSVREVHSWLRPPSSRYKTNSEFDIGKRVILRGVVTRAHGGYRAAWQRDLDSHFRALDNVFALLDGKPAISTYHGPLMDAMSKAIDGTGETAYFRFRCHLNGNLHLEFLRPDLVAKLNAIAGGNRLYAGGAR